MTCKSCKSADIIEVLSLIKQPLANSFHEETDNSKEKTYPLRIECCKNCELVQLSDDSYVSRDLLFKEYSYASSVAEGLRNHFKEFANTLAKEFDNDSLLVDIGSNDGVFLKPLKEAGIKAIGVESAQNLAELANSKDLNTLCGFFDAKTVGTIMKEYGKADIITASNVFAHLEEINSFTNDVKSLLKSSGIFIVEIQYFGDMIKDMTFDNIYHEHVLYWTITSLNNFFTNHDMTVFRVERINTHGGSLRVYVAKDNRIVENSVKDLMNEERVVDLNNKNTIMEFANNVDLKLAKLREVFKELKDKGNKIAGYGAPAKSSTLINSIGLTNETIDYIVEDSRLKQGLVTPGSKIPIVDSNMLETNKPDYLVIFAWNYADEIIRKIEDKYQKFNYIIPMPELKIIQNSKH